MRDSRIPSLPCLPSLFCPRWIPKTLYYEKIIRDEKALANIRSYIMNNPLNWDMDEENPKIDEYQPDILLDLPF